MIGLKRGTVKLTSDHDEWNNLFEHERKTLRKKLGSNIKIEHVGSTAIPGIPAKPIIDIVIGYNNEVEKENVYNKLMSCGYEDMGDRGRVEHRLFVKGPDDNRTHYIHITKINSAGWDDYVLFRDFLLQNKDARSAYTDLKTDLAEKHEYYRPLYTEGKAEFISNIIIEAKKLL